MSKHCEIRLSGSGGQGLILAGIILAEAAIMEDKNAIQTQSYGPEARGGASKAEVIISDREIDFPKVQNADIVLALTQVASDKYIKTVSEDGIIIVDESINVPADVKARKIYKLPILRTASEKVGKSIVANIVAIGILAEFSEMVSRTSVENAVLSRVPKGTEDLNRTALDAGYELAIQNK